MLRATSHTRLKAHDHCDLRVVIGWKGGDRSSSLHTRKWRPKAQRRLHGWKMYMESYAWRTMDKVSWSPRIFVRSTSKRWTSLKFRETMIFLISSQHDWFQGRFQNVFHIRLKDRFHDRQTSPSSSLKLVEFETYYIKPNRPLLFRQQNMQGPTTWSILTSQYAWGSVTT